MKNKEKDVVKVDDFFGELSCLIQKLGYLEHLFYCVFDLKNFLKSAPNFSLDLLNTINNMIDLVQSRVHELVKSLNLKMSGGFEINDGKKKG